MLAGLVKQAFSRKPASPFLQQRHQRAGAGGLDRFNDDLVFGRSRIGGDLAGGDHFQPLFGTVLEPREHAFPDYRLDASLVVLE